MKIYNKKRFAYGAFMGLMSALYVIVSISKREVGVKEVMMISLLLLFSIFEIRKSLSARLSKEARREERDERNQLVDLKSKSKAFRVMQIIAYACMFPIIIAGAWHKNNVLIGVGFTLAALFTLSLFVELITFMYYERRN